MHPLFILDNANKPLLHFHNWEWREPESRTATLDGGDDFIHIIANNAEPDILGILLYDATQSRLGLLSHHVCFV